MSKAIEDNKVYFENLKLIEIQNANIEEIKEDTFSAFKQLQHLIIRDSKVKKVHPYAFNKLHNLVTLVLDSESKSSYVLITEKPIKYLSLNISIVEPDAKGYALAYYNKSREHKTVPVDAKKLPSEVYEAIIGMPYIVPYILPLLMEMGKINATEEVNNVRSEYFNCSERLKKDLERDMKENQIDLFFEKLYSLCKDKHIRQELSSLQIDWIEKIKQQFASEMRDLSASKTYEKSDTPTEEEKNKNIFIARNMPADTPPDSGRY